MNSTPMHRRTLLKVLGAAGLLAQLPFASAGFHSLPSPRLAVFLPRSGRYPTLPQEYLAGLNLGLAQHGLDSKDMLPIEYAANPAKGIREAQTLLANEHMDVMTGVMCPTAALTLEPQLLAAGVPLLVNDCGANRMQAGEQSRIIIRQSLEYWQSCAAFGQWAPQQLGHRALLALGSLECGYDFPAAFSDAFAANGGTVVATHVSGLPQADQEFSGLEAAIQAHKPDFVFALYSGPQAQRFLDHYRASATANKTLLASGGFLGINTSDGVSGPDMSIASWHAAKANCSHFAKACDAGNLRITPFSVLGYESGNRIGTAWLAARFTFPAFVAALHATPSSGPRAHRQYHQASMETCGAHWIADCGAIQNSMVEVNMTEPFSNRHPLAKTAATQQRGWLNPYLVT
jgi:ABC-type branched-subunit amino acid transport system substrate-binding protein